LIALAILSKALSYLKEFSYAGDSTPLYIANEAYGTPLARNDKNYGIVWIR